MKVEQLIEMGYSKIGTHNGLELWSNFYSKNGVKKGTNVGLIYLRLKNKKSFKKLFTNIER